MFIRYYTYNSVAESNLSLHYIERVSTKRVEYNFFFFQDTVTVFDEYLAKEESVFSYELLGEPVDETAATIHNLNMTSLTYLDGKLY